MPIYEYQCAVCGAEFERLVRGDIRIRCPSCDTTRVERRMSVTALPAGPGSGPSLSNLGPPKGGCGGGGCGCH